MTQRDNILDELRELQSTLLTAGTENTYRAPDGYFDSLPDLVLNRIRALDATDPVEELGHLSPLLSTVSKEMPYSVPAGYFEGLTETVVASVNNDDPDPVKELETLSPFLSGLKKEIPYSVPAGYFEGLARAIPAETVQTTPVISIARHKWFRYAAAAVIIGLVTLTGLLIFNKPGTVDPKEKSFAWVEKNMIKVSTDDIDDFVQLTEETAPVTASVDVKTANEVKDLIKDIPDKDIQDFLDETQSDESENNDNSIMN